MPVANNISYNNAMEQHFAQRIQSNPNTCEIADFLNQKQATRRAISIIRLAEDSHKNRVRVTKLRHLLQELQYPKSVNRDDLTPLIGYFIFHGQPSELKAIPLNAAA